MSLETRKLGLAAYIKMHGGVLKGLDGATNTFVFVDETDKTIHEWELAYVNSCCHRHDTELVNLRKLIRK